MKGYYLELGTCQPTPIELFNNIFPKIGDKNGEIRSFHESYYTKTLPDGTCSRRSWLSYSPSLNRIFCISCKIFGLPKAKNMIMASSGSNDFKNLKRNIEAHETCMHHLQAEISRTLFASNYRIDVEIVHSANQKIADNREILKVVIDVLVYIARQNISLRGHNESCSSMNKGNLLELLQLLAKYHPILQNHLNKIGNKKKNRLTLLSHDSQNKLLKILADIVRSFILKQVQKSGLFSVIIDTTTDIAKLEQFCLVIRYVDEYNKVQERLVSLETAPDSSGLGMFQLFSKITETHNIDWKTQLCAQAYDGASCMQGIYSGLRTHIQKENPRAVYIWCFAHVINLVVVDTCDCSVETKVFLGDIQAINEFMRARKRTAKFIHYQKECFPKDRIRRLKHFSTTRWTSHGRAIDVVYEKYQALLKTLNYLSTADDLDRDTVSKAKSLANTISSFKFIISMELMKSIFSITTPLSKCLQSKNLDFIQALVLIDEAQKSLQYMRSDEGFMSLVNAAKTFSSNQNLTEVDFREIRHRRKKQMAGEIAMDETVMLASERYKTTVYFVVLDTIINAISTRFCEAKEILKDLSLLSPQRILFYSNNGPKLPEDAFEDIGKWLPSIDPSNLRTEYYMFTKSLQGLLDGLVPNKLHQIENNPLDNDSCNSTDTESSLSENDCINSKETLTTDQLFQVISNFGIRHAFPNLYIAYRALLTIPAASASAERAFSKVIAI